jgi:catechol 2,3-dioxygenase-like lactoylglutathione lyase family enzyme
MLTEARTMLPAADLDRFRAFYHDKLGLDPTAEHEDMRMLEYHSDGGPGFEVYETENAGSAKNTQMVWMTDDLDAEMKRLRDAGVEFDDFEIPDMKTENGVVANDEMKSAWFHDSEGNILCITQVLH